MIITFERGEVVGVGVKGISVEDGDAGAVSVDMSDGEDTAGAHATRVTSKTNRIKGASFGLRIVLILPRRSSGCSVL
jgi:hypothetical protein